MTDLAKSNIVFTGRQVVAGAFTCAATLSVAAWAIATFTLGSVSDDVADIRTQIVEGRGVSRDLDNENRRMELQLREQLTELIAQLRATNTALSGLAGNVAGLDSSIVNLDERVAGSVSRQQEFEKWVVATLGAVDSPSLIEGSFTPKDWTGSQVEIIDNLHTGNDPLASWYKALDGQN